MAWLTETEMKTRYRHFSLRNFPFEDTIIDVIPSDGVRYADRKEWVTNLYLLMSKGYYIKCTEFFGPSAVPISEEEFPYQYFLRGALDLTYCIAYANEMEDALTYVKNILSRGKIIVFKYINGVYAGRYSFEWMERWYSYLDKSCLQN
jgi:hypothetical protein